VYTEQVSCQDWQAALVAALRQYTEPASAEVDNPAQ
jgi:hypothetical protein